MSERRAVREMIHGCLATQLIYVAAELGLADLLAQGPRTGEDLARAVGAEPGALYRVLRALESIGIFAENDDGRFAMTARGAVLQKDAEGSLHGVALLWGEVFWQPFGDLLHSVKTGQTAIEKQRGMGFYDHLERDPRAAEIFVTGIAGLSELRGHEVAAVYDFSGVQKLVDVGGGNGSFLAAILQAYPHLLGVVLELPEVARRAREHVAGLPGGSRCQVVAGDFFDAVPRGADAYIVKGVIHNWEDERAVAILGNCRRAMSDDGTLLLVERVVAPGRQGRLAKFKDITMLAITGGVERTAAELVSLLDAAGFSLVRELPLDLDMAILVARPVHAGR